MLFVLLLACISTLRLETITKTFLIKPLNKYTMSQEEKNAVLLVIAISFYIASIYHFIDSHDYIYSLKKGMTKEYVNGDAYNYIIAASYSSTIMLKSIWFAILGSCSLLLIKPVPNQTEK